ncbi:hypothetical protein NECAME_12549 [Necator americanus]|uniref:Uncharacterized protein n=1 Tax=Necator americanus TaxID=51031 RepID=W2T219_NECAM|nr:hypothetical protein NECAME_12549 [Necator americanus]ETN75027.1 hypothetical protein NECAME_12549 [Necator americanus]
MQYPSAEFERYQIKPHFYGCDDVQLLRRLKAALAEVFGNPLCGHEFLEIREFLEIPSVPTLPKTDFTAEQGNVTPKL